jgi:hypothetical protein
MHGKYSQDTKHEENGDFILGHEHVTLMNVGKLIDGYLAEIAYDPNLTISSFVDLSRSIPEFGRPIHDGLYKAIDIYLKVVFCALSNFI